MSDDRQLFGVVVTEDGCIALSGELDLLTVPDLNDALGTRNGARDVTLDVSGLTFIDSSGLHAIVTFLRSREPEGTVTLRGVSPEFLRILEITQLTKLPRLLIDG
jgi:anti-anti-sigma factor